VNDLFKGCAFKKLETITDAFNGKTILVTGGRGFIGSALAQFLAAVNGKLILLDRSTTSTWEPERHTAEVVFLKGDVSIRETWNSALPGVDYVFHLAGQEYVRGSEYDPLLDLQFNALPVLHLLETCRDHNYRPTIVFASSANLFGLAKSLPVNEDQRDNPLIPWTIHKLMAEGYFRAYAQQYGIHSIILRLANVYGPTARQSVMKRVVINGMIAKALAGEELTLYANHNCVRDYVFLADIIQAFLLAGIQTEAKEYKNGLYIVGSGEGKTIAETWQLIADRVNLHVNKNVVIKFDPLVDVGLFEMRNFIADSTRFQSTTGWKPRVGLIQGIDLTIQALITNQS